MGAARRRRRCSSSPALLVVAGLLEIVWATAIKQSNDFTRLWPSVICVVAAAVSFVSSYTS